MVSEWNFTCVVEPLTAWQTGVGVGLGSAVSVGSGDGVVEGTTAVGTGVPCEIPAQAVKIKQTSRKKTLNRFVCIKEALLEVQARVDRTLPRWMGRGG